MASPSLTASSCSCISSLSAGRKTVFNPRTPQRPGCAAVSRSQASAEEGRSFAPSTREASNAQQWAPMGHNSNETLQQGMLRRRQLVQGLIVMSVGCCTRARAEQVWEVGEGGKRELPQSYVKFARKLLDALRDSIEVDLSPANEAEVRRKADPAKALVKEWVSDWRDARSVATEVSYKKITESLQLLGEFYLKKGQRARLPSQLGSEILRRLDAASAALPA